MALKSYKPTTPGRRHRVDLDRSYLTDKEPEKSLTAPLKKKAGRSKGRIAVRHKGGGAKRMYRKVDFKRDKKNIEATVKAIEYDPNRSCDIALLVYADGEKRYILAPKDLEVGAVVFSGDDVEVKVGNALPLGKIPVGMSIHNLELSPGRGGQVVRSAGNAARITAKEGKYSIVKLPSGEVRKFLNTCYATVGEVGCSDWKLVKLGKAGRKRHMGVRPSVRGVAQHPGAHPHGGGEGRSGIGMPSPKSPWGKKTLGKKTRRAKKKSDRLIIERRN